MFGAKLPVIVDKIFRQRSQGDTDYVGACVAVAMRFARACLAAAAPARIAPVNPPLPA